MIDVAYYDGVNKGEDKLQLQIARKDGYSDRGEEVEEMDLQHNGKGENASGEEREYLGASSTITGKKMDLGFLGCKFLEEDRICT